MASCCLGAEFAKGKADSCNDCEADCSFTKMTELCNAHFGKACLLRRRPFSKNNITMAVVETFCVPKDCDNSQDLKNNLLVKWYDAQYRQDRKVLWLYDYSDADPLECPTMTVTIIVAVLVSIVVAIVSIPVAIFLFKAPKERGRVLRSAEEEVEEEEDDKVEPMAALEGTS